MTAGTLSIVKADPAQLLAVLGLKCPGNHGTCRFCGDRTGLSTFSRDGAWFFKCHRCDASGDVVTALTLAEKITAGEAIKRLTMGATNLTAIRQPSRFTVREPAVPVIDRERTYRVFHPAIETIISGRADKWLAKRGIARDWIMQCPNLGFIESLKIKGWKYPLQNSWIIRVCDADGECHALKIHRENPPEMCPKAAWLPFGTQPADDPNHGWATLWPPPEWFPFPKPIFVCEGELKAARAISGGYAATSPTTGASCKWTPESVARLAGRHLRVIFDDDVAGRKFRDATVLALREHVASLKTGTPGQMGAPA